MLRITISRSSAADIGRADSSHDRPSGNIRQNIAAGNDPDQNNAGIEVGLHGLHWSRHSTTGRISGFMMKPSFWIMAARPRTLSLSVTPVAVGAALAWASDRHVHASAVMAALAGSIFIQIGTNLHNDAIDSERGGDGPDRIGPPRVTASGLLSAHDVKRAACACYAVAALVGLYLVAVGGWPILWLGVLSIVSGWAYTGGPLPIAYTPLGELFVIVFFGIGAVCGTYWLCVNEVSLAVLEAGIALGTLTGAVLLVNNYRDVEADVRVGRRTLAIVAGPRVTVWIYAGLMALPFVLLLPIGHALPHGHVWPALAALPLAVVLIYRFMHEPQGLGLNRFMVWTVQIQLLFSLLLTIGLVL
jgi:1,4-dihydroxy-2-naphthoate octaprenyltransferase